MLNTFLNLLVGAVAAGGGTVMVRVVRRECAERRAQVQAWHKEWDAHADTVLAFSTQPTTGPQVGEAATFRVPAQSARPVVVDVVVVDQAPERVR